MNSQAAGTWETIGIIGGIGGIGSEVVISTSYGSFISPYASEHWGWHRFRHPGIGERCPPGALVRNSLVVAGESHLRSGTATKPPQGNGDEL